MLGQGKAPFHIPSTLPGRSYYQWAIARLFHLPQQITFTHISCRVMGSNFLKLTSEVMPDETKLWNTTNQPQLHDIRVHLPGSKTNSPYSQSTKKSTSLAHDQWYALGPSWPVGMGFTYIVCKTIHGEANYAVKEQNVYSSLLTRQSEMSIAWRAWSLQLLREIGTCLGKWKDNVTTYSIVTIGPPCSQAKYSLIFQRPFILSPIWVGVSYFSSLIIPGALGDLNSGT